MLPSFYLLAICLKGETCGVKIWHTPLEISVHMLKRGLESRLNSAWICDSHQLLQRSPAATVTELPPPCRDPVCVRVCYVTNLDASHVTLKLLKNMSQVFFSFLILYINGGIKGAVWIFMRITVCRLSIKRPGSWYLHLYKDLTWQAPVTFRQFKWTAECCQPSRLLFFFLTFVNLLNPPC